MMGPRIESEHPDGAGARVAVALEDLDGGRLPGAIRPKEGEHLATGHGKSDALEDLTVEVRLPQTFDLDDRRAICRNTHVTKIRSCI